MVARMRIALALVEYRAGNLEESLEWSGNSEEFNVDYLTSLALLLQSMAEFRLGKTDEARQMLLQATELMPPGFRSSGRSGYDGPFPLPSQMVHSDSLFAEILRREAEATIVDKEQPVDDSPPDKRATRPVGPIFSPTEILTSDDDPY